MRYKTLLSLLFIFFFVIMSGCVNKGILFSEQDIVKEFAATPSKIYSNEEAYIKMILRNDQDFFVKNIYVYLYNVGNDWGIIDVWGDKTHKVSNSYWSFDVDASFHVNKNYKIGDSNVILNGDIKIQDIENILKGKLPTIGLDNVNLYIMRNDISIMVNDLEDFLGVAYKNNYKRISDVKVSRIYKTADKLPPIYIDYLYPPNYEHGKGEEVEVYWVLKPPLDIPKGKTIDNNIKARVCYEGVNRLTKAIHLISRNEFLYQNKKITKKIVSSNSGPVSISLEVNDPIIISPKKGDNDNIIPMTLIVKNVGKGTVTSESCKEIMGLTKEGRENSKINKFKVSVKGDINMICDVQDEEFYLMRNNEIKIPVTCEIISDNVPEEEKYIDIEISYTYYEDLSTSLHVEGI